MDEVFWQDSFLDEVEVRATAALGLQLASQVGPAPRDLASTPAYIARLTRACMTAIDHHGWHVLPSYPGETRGPEILASGDTRFVYTAELLFGTERLGTIFTVVILGRAPLINVAPPEH